MDELLVIAWTQGILTSSLAQQPTTGLEVIRCVQSFLDARLASLPRLAPPPAEQSSLESQDEYGDEFAMIDMNDPSLQALLDGFGPIGRDQGKADAPVVGAVEPPSRKKATTVEEIRAKDLMFAKVVKETLSPAIYRLLSNMVASSVGDEEGRETRNVGGGEAGRKEDERIAKADYIDQLVDCWAGCASVLVQHGHQVSIE